MNLKKILVIALVLMAIITSLSVVSAGFFDFLNPQDTITITVESDDTNVSGKLMLIEFKNITENSNGTYNTSQFGTNDGEWNGEIKYVDITDGKGLYTLNEGTQFFALDNYIFNLTKEYDIYDKSAPYFDVKIVSNGKEVASSHEQAYMDQCDVSIGGMIYAINGTALTEEQINVDLPELIEIHDDIVELGIYD